jgi:nitroreductase
MEFYDVLSRRFACRCFLDKPVSPIQVRELVALAQMVPSWSNTQPWKVYAVAGLKSQVVRRKLVKAHFSGQPVHPDIPMPQGFSGLLLERYRELGRGLFAALDIGRDDEQKRQAHAGETFDAFGAPVLIFFTVPAGKSPYATLDAGAFITAFCLAASEQGLATCILAALASYPQVVRAVVEIPEDEDIVLGLALGYPDLQDPVNQFRSTRAPVEEVLSLAGF